ncbi:hypothetical protein LOK49_LG04G00817 [Camellia lanceoleosa]|uniref:Uncharacterized protein n=1 Tax=Camellia lanceoleosa TaxID=1840588 RepID=A0ACC0I3G4_9ERIC|nr:hypothetical protein LOK49_LG04G00817 [Camellia lanceoleosa]
MREETMGTHISLSLTDPKSCPAKKRVGFSVPDSCAQKKIHRHSLSLFRRRQRLRRVEFLCCNQQPLTLS